ncbi:terminase small subunit [Bradyrhizobium sp. 145]|uniref:terminase small subunit n=1 Tax=Bradyrhizobium sp. 145 TaxID=2782621 RepID=UPI001FFB5C9F|nr:terminase small subunit [Bradyrhizobium sp. 145]
MNSDATTPALTPKQARFVQEYLLDLNATQAAIRAGYSQRTAQEQGSQLLSHPGVVAAIDAAKLKRSERTEVDADWMLRRLVEEAEADLADLYDARGDLKPIELWPEIWRQGLVAGVEIDALYEGAGDDRRQIGHVKKIKLSDRLRRLELIGKHIRVNAFQEVVAVNGVEALADRIARAKGRANAGELIDASPLRAVPAPAPPAIPPPAPASESVPVAQAAPAAPSPPPAPKPAYKPIMPTPEPAPWPSFGGFAATDYDPTT